MLIRPEMANITMRLSTEKQNNYYPPRIYYLENANSVSVTHFYYTAM